ncbi:transposase [Fimbriiglobus ruber]|uniref:Transposase n=1 Tax=Fimbriiglobus ruber TaxID=1908690 RepID=A0A225D0C0_9BACT|nr:transposase [Fimbriiglobus ruber]
MIDPCTAGDPDQPGCLWTNLSRAQIAHGLQALGFRVSVVVVAQLLTRHRLGRRKALKTLPLGKHRCQDRQFQIIARYRDEFLTSPDPIVSIDTKHKEFLGLLFRVGRLYTRLARKALDHDFPSAAWGVIYPHGLYDLKRNCGHLNLGLSHDTSRFACDRIAYWWQEQGRFAYPEARRVLLLCDGGGRNASHRYVFKYHLERLADRLGLELRIAHYPPHCSKYNAIEHRLFPHVTRACQGLLLTSLQVAVKAMERTSTRKGLTTTVHVLDGDDPLKEGYPEEYRETMKIRFDEELPAWNYRAVPSKWDS